VRECKETPGGILFARQRIVDRQEQTFGYELLWRASDGSPPNGSISPNEMTETVLQNLLRHHNKWSDLWNGERLFVNASPAFLAAGGLASLHPLVPHFPFIVELHETVVGTAEIAALAKDLKALGAQIALDDFVWQPGSDILLSVADLVKLDLDILSPRSVKAHVERLCDWGVLLLAERVETEEDVQRCRDLGFDLFQGYYYAKPELVYDEQHSGLLSQNAAPLPSISKQYTPSGVDS